MDNATILRAAAIDDAPALLDIYNHYVRTSTVTFDLDEWSIEDMIHKIESVREQGLPFFVAETDGRINGYAYLSQWREKRAYETTAENTVYLHPDAVGKGLGGRLLDALIESAPLHNIREIMAVITATTDAEASFWLHSRRGFVKVGAMPNVGRKFDEWIGITMLQLSIR